MLSDLNKFTATKILIVICKMKGSRQHAYCQTMLSARTLSLSPPGRDVSLACNFRREFV